MVVVPPSLLFRSGREQQLREWLLRENTVEAVVSIPRGAFSPHTSIETCLLLFRRGGTTKSVRMVNAESIFEKADKSQIAAAPFVMAGQLGHHVRSPEPGREWWDVVVIERSGDVRMIYDESIDPHSLGRVTIRRGSHVEPTADGRWTADLSPAAGPQLGPFARRSEALAAELDWLRQHWLLQLY